MANQSYIRILQAIEAFSSAHMQIKKFASDFPGQMPNFATEDEAYPILFVSPTSSVFDMNTTTFTINVYCFDIIQKDRENINTILSDTHLILSDLNRWILDSDPAGFDIIDTPPTLTPIDNALLDYAAGWQMTLTLVAETYGVCEIPFSETPIITTEVNNIIYTSYLTCETLSSCPVITGITEDIIVLQNEVAGLTGQTVSVTVTGGTYNVSTNDFTYTNSTGGTFTVTGNTLTKTAYDAYLGSRLNPTDTSVNGFGITKSVNGVVGSIYKNTDATSNGAYASNSVGGDGTNYENSVGLNFFGKGYYVPYLRNTGSIFSTNDLNIININNSKIDFRTGNAFGSETSKFSISSGGTLTIGTAPTTDNTITYLLGRKTDSTVVQLDKSTLIKRDIRIVGTDSTIVSTDKTKILQCNNEDFSITIGNSVGTSGDEFIIINPTNTIPPSLGIVGSLVTIEYNGVQYNNGDSIALPIGSQANLICLASNSYFLSIVTIGSSPSGDFVPYTGGTKDLVLSANSITANGGLFSNWSGGQFLVNSQVTVPNMFFTDAREVDGNAITTSQQIDVENGINYSYSNTTNGNSTTVQTKNEFIVNTYSGIDPVILGNFYVTPTGVLTNKSVTASEGFITTWTNGYFNAGIPYAGGNRQFSFFDRGDGVEFSTGQTVNLIMNVEEGLQGSYVSGPNSSGFALASNLYLSSNDNITTDYNLITVSPTETNGLKKITTNEGFVGNYVQFNTGATETSAVGKLKWNDTDGTLDLGLKGGAVTLQIGQELVARVVNKTGADLLESEFRVVRVRSVSEGGAQGQRLAVKLAQANNDFNSAETLGVVTETINNNQEGFITTFGQVKAIDTTGAMSYGGTETWVDGDMLYLSPDYPGYMTNVKPIAPQHMVVIGYVEYAHSQNGKIFVKVNNGYELDELHNVQISGATDGQVLTYDSANTLWKNQTLPSATFSGGTVTGPTNFTNGLTANTISATTYSNLPTIASQIGFKPYKFVNTSQTLHTGTLAETILATALISGGTFNSSDVMKVLAKFTKATANTTMTLRMRINTTNTLVGATQVATYTFAAANTFGIFSRTFDLDSGNLYGYNFASSIQNDITPTNTVGSSTTYNTANDLYFFFTVQLGNVIDSVKPNLQNIIN